MANPRMTAEIGRVLGGRYRLVAPIGMGASAQVYLADDVRLRRRVAVKMLHDALAGDQEFLRRFRAEARAAAALSHPNVTAVFDWGDDEVPYIVTEYLSGGSLRALLDQGGLLSPSQALVVGLEATRALDYAHRRGFVHRDIKPANLLFGEDARLRIADFGLARALAEAAWTEPQGAVLGTARYASPEQANGQSLDGKADVYSLALLLVEAVTGEVPFVADTTLGTLMARIDRPLPVPDALGPLKRVLERAGHPDPSQRIDARTLAAGLLRAAKSLPTPAPLPLAGALQPADALVADADPTVHAPTVPEPDLTAEDLGLDPPDWVNQADRTMPLAMGAAFGAGAAVGAGIADGEPGASEDGAAVGSDDVEPDGVEQEVADAGPPAVEEQPADGTDADTGPEAGTGSGHDEAGPDRPAALAGAVAGRPTWHDAGTGGGDPVDRVVDPTAVVRPAARVPAPATAGGVATLTAPADAPPLVLHDEPHDDDPRRRRWPWVLLVLVLLVGGGGAAAAAVLTDREPAEPVREVTLPVPDLTGLSQDEARDLAQAAGWKVDFQGWRQDGTTKGQILASTPAAGERLEDGRTIRVRISVGQTMVEVPADVVGMPEGDAVMRMAEAGLKADTAEHRYDEEVPAGVVIGLADGTQPRLERDSTVGLVISDGPRPRTVPELVGSTVDEARAALAAEGLEIAVVESYDENVRKGIIFSVQPQQGATVDRGSVVSVNVSLGPKPVKVPDVRKASSLAEAVALLRRAGLKEGEVSGPASGRPRATRPAAGTEVAPGTAVDIVLGGGDNGDD